MFGRIQVVAVVPAGRRRYLEILIPYLSVHKGLIDRCDLWCNTDDADDLVYLRQVAATNPFFRLIESRIPIDGIRSIYHFFRYCVEPDTVYIRFDDDVCWIAPDAIENLIQFRLEHLEPPLVLANTINNGICSHIHQRLGCIPTVAGFCPYDATGDLGWRSGLFARLAHESFLEKLAVNQQSDYLFPQWYALEHERISINCISWLGEAFARFSGEVGMDEEVWLTMVYPAAIGRSNTICGTALVSHFAYGPQRSWLETHTDLLVRYKVLSRTIKM